MRFLLGSIDALACTADPAILVCFQIDGGSLGLGHDCGLGRNFGGWLCWLLERWRLDALNRVLLRSKLTWVELGTRTDCGTGSDEVV